MRVCAINGKTDVAALLIEAGANVNMKDKDGKTPLMVCIYNKCHTATLPVKERDFVCNWRNILNSPIP